jgi:hypothetical protein
MSARTDDNLTEEDSNEQTDVIHIHCVNDALCPRIRVHRGYYAETLNIKP